MHVIVIGAGVVGVTTAYYLRRRGLDVTVVERNAGVAQETSFGNAGVLAPAYVAPWSQPGMPGKVLAYLFRREAPIVFRPRLQRDLWRWLWRWYRECRVERFRVNRARMQRLAYYSRDCLHTLRARHAIDYEQERGYLQLFRTPAELERTAPARQMLTEAGVPHRLLSADECRAQEPALAASTPLAGALHLPDDEVGNCAYFTRRLKEICAADGVEFRFSLRAERLAAEAGEVTGLQCDGEALTADRYIVAAGVDSRALLDPLGLRLPLLPVRGYSATVAITRLEHAPHLSVMDEAYKVAITRLGQRLRIAGTAEIGGDGRKLRPSSLRTLIRVARDWFPAAASYAQAQFWCGARPMLPDGPPVLGATPVRNLFLNVGHGSSGWMLACGSANAVTRIVAGDAAEIDLDGLTLERYR
jgi:D-amino-acid dehydrogenase